MLAVDEHLPPPHVGSVRRQVRLQGLAAGDRGAAEDCVRGGGGNTHSSGLRGERWPGLGIKGQRPARGQRSTTKRARLQGFGVDSSRLTPQAAAEWYHASLGSTVNDGRPPMAVSKVESSVVDLKGSKVSLHLAEAPSVCL